MKPEPLIVQVRDADGFWCNAANFDGDPKHAKNYARHWTDEHGVSTRVVRGAERQVIATFSPRAAPAEPSEGPREYQ